MCRTPVAHLRRDPGTSASGHFNGEADGYAAIGQARGAPGILPVGRGRPDKAYRFWTARCAVILAPSRCPNRLDLIRMLHR